MDKRRLGEGGPLVSAIGVGAMSFAGFYGSATETQSHAVLEAALDLGIDHIDTADVYGAGRSEEIIGRFIASRGGRSPFTIATKAGIVNPRGSGPRRFDNSRRHLEGSLHGSLRRLGVEAIDLFYVHRREPHVPIEEVTETLAGFVRAGKILSFGFSEIAPASLRRAAAVHPVAAVQSEYSLWTRSVELGLLQACAELGTALVAFSPVGRGALTDAPPDREKIAATPFLAQNPRFEESNHAENLRYIDRFRRLAADMGSSAAAVAIAWLLHRAPSVIPIPGTRSVDHLRELAQGCTLKLDGSDIQRIEACLPVGWAHGDRYSEGQWVGPERYC